MEQFGERFVRQDFMPEEFELTLCTQWRPKLLNNQLFGHNLDELTLVKNCNLGANT